ncbi:MAG: phosphotransferase family protein [Nostocoides sp.]
MTDDIQPAALSALLSAHVEPGIQCDAALRSAVGNGQETWFLDTHTAAGHSRKFVLRRSAVAGVLDDTDRAHEFATLAILQDHGLPTPRVYWLETEPSSLGRPFFVMDRLSGSPPAPRTDHEAAAIARDLGRRLAQLHLSGVPADDDTDAGAFTDREINRWRTRYAERRPAPVPIIGALLGWLAANRPDDSLDPVLLWGDAGPHNVLVEDGHVSALLDWELSHTGHPIEDLGAAVWACLGRYPQDSVIAGYEEESGTTVDRDVLAYYAVLGCVSRSVMQLAGVSAFTTGETNALNLGGLGLALPIANLVRAAEYARWPQGSGSSPAPESGEDELRLRPDVTETLSGVARFLSEDLLPATEAAYLRRGIKTAVALLDVSARRSREDGPRAQRLQVAVDDLFDRLAAAGVHPVDGRRDAAALEAAAIHVETDERFEQIRPEVRGVLVDGVRERASTLEAVVRLYGADVQPAPSFAR